MTAPPSVGPGARSARASCLDSKAPSCPDDAPAGRRGRGAARKRARRRDQPRRRALQPRDAPDESRSGEHPRPRAPVELARRHLRALEKRIAESSAARSANRSRRHALSTTRARRVPLQSDTAAGRGPVSRRGGDHRLPARASTAPTRPGSFPLASPPAPALRGFRSTRAVRISHELAAGVRGPAHPGSRDRTSAPARARRRRPARGAVQRETAGKRVETATGVVPGAGSRRAARRGRQPRQRPGVPLQRAETGFHRILDLYVVPISGAQPTVSPATRQPAPRPTCRSARNRRERDARRAEPRCAHPEQRIRGAGSRRARCSTSNACCCGGSCTNAQASPRRRRWRAPSPTAWRTPPHRCRQLEPPPAASGAQTAWRPRSSSRAPPTRRSPRPRAASAGRIRAAKQRVEAAEAASIRRSRASRCSATGRA